MGLLLSHSSSSLQQADSKRHVNSRRSCTLAHRQIVEGRQRHSGSHSQRSDGCRQHRDVVVSKVQADQACELQGPRRDGGQADE